jgi:hypothetical protein
VSEITVKYNSEVQLVQWSSEPEGKGTMSTVVSSEVQWSPGSTVYSDEYEVRPEWVQWVQWSYSEYSELQMKYNYGGLMEVQVFSEYSEYEWAGEEQWEQWNYSEVTVKHWNIPRFR